MRIAFPYPGYWPYVRRGVERCIHDYGTYLAGRGHDVHVITSTPGRPRTARDGEMRVTYLRQVNHPLLFRYAPALRQHAFGLEASRVIWRDRPDVMHLFTYSGLPWAPLLSRRLDVPYLFHMIISPLAAGQLIYPELRGAERALALTEPAATAIERVYGVRCGVLPPPLDLDTFRPVAARSAQPTIFFPADFAEARKGGRLLLRAWNEVHRRRPEARLVLGGSLGVAGWLQDSAGRSLLHQLDAVETAAARDAIEVRGPGELDSLPEWYSRAWVTVLPSVDEAFGMALTESLACGTPVVASRHGGGGEIIRDPAVGVTVDLRELADLDSARQASDLAEAILAAVELAALPTTAARCREWAAQWSVERVGAQLEAYLEAAAGIETTARAGDEHEEPMLRVAGS